MDTGKVKVVLTALREELQARRATGTQPAAGAADDGAVLPARAVSGIERDGGQGNHGEHDQHSMRAPSGILVDLSSDAVESSKSPRLIHAAALSEDAESVGVAELSQRPIPELVVPFFVPQEPFVAIAPYLVRALLAATAAGVLMFFLF